MRYYLFLLFSVLMLQACGPRHVLVVTDIGTDVDDAEAICLAAGEPSVNIIGIACTASEHEKRAEKAKHLLSLLGRDDIPVGSDAAFIDSAICRTRGKSEVLLIAQATSLSEALMSKPSLSRKIRRIYFQGQASADSSGRLVPNIQAFNVSEDVAAAESLFAFQDRISFTVVGKYAAYPLALTRQIFDGYASSGNPAGALLKQMAVESIENFAKNNPERYRKVYKDTNYISNPYDAVAFLAMVEPECFMPEIIGKNVLIGVSEGASGINSSKCNILQYRLKTIFLPLRP